MFNVVIINSPINLTNCIFNRKLVQDRLLGDEDGILAFSWTIRRGLFSVISLNGLAIASTSTDKMSQQQTLYCKCFSVQMEVVLSMILTQLSYRTFVFFDNMGENSCHPKRAPITRQFNWFGVVSKRESTRLVKAEAHVVIFLRGVIKGAAVRAISWCLSNESPERLFQIVIPKNILNSSDDSGLGKSMVAFTLSGHFRSTLQHGSKIQNVHEKVVFCYDSSVIIFWSWLRQARKLVLHSSFLVLPWTIDYHRNSWPLGTQSLELPSNLIYSIEFSECCLNFKRQCSIY